MNFIEYQVFQFCQHISLWFYTDNTFYVAVQFCDFTSTTGTDILNDVII
jgi:hypothetical protein